MIPPSVPASRMVSTSDVPPRESTAETPPMPNGGGLLSAMPSSVNMLDGVPTTRTTTTTGEDTGSRGENRGGRSRSPPPMSRNTAGGDRPNTFDGFLPRRNNK